MYTHIHTYTIICVYIYIDIHITSYIYIYIYVYTYVHTYIHTYIFTYIHTYMHAIITTTIVTMTLLYYYFQVSWLYYYHCYVMCLSYIASCLLSDGHHGVSTRGKHAGILCLSFFKQENRVGQYSTNISNGIIVTNDICHEWI